MKGFTKGLLAAGLLALSAPAMAAMPNSNMKPEMNQQTSAYPGTIKSVNASKDTVTLEVPLAPGATILKNGQNVSLKQIKQGDEVRASFDPMTHEIMKLDVHSKGMKGTKSSSGY